MLKTKKLSSLDRVLRTVQIKTQRRTRRELLDWIAHHGIKLAMGGEIKPFSLAGHEYLREIYEEHVPHEVFEKAAQVGISTVMILKALWLADERVLKILYYFPDDGSVEEFGDDRLTPIIQQTPYLSERVEEAKESGGVYNKGLKHVGKSSIYLRGMVSRTKVKSVDGDYLVLDELDECNQKNREFAEDRIMHSSLQWISELSQPSVPDYGIDKNFQDSDQRFWLLRCPACGHWNNLEENFPKNFFRRRGADGWYRGCLKCEAPLEMCSGQWVAKFPGREIRGYHLSQLYTTIRPADCADPADKIMKKYLGLRKAYEKERYQISVIGFPFAGERQPISDQVLDACEEEYLPGIAAGRASGIGIDVGDILHLVVRGRAPGGITRILWAESTDSWTRLAEIIKMFGAPTFVIDAMPYKSSAKELVRAFPGRGYLQYFKSSEKITTEGEDEKEVPVIQVDRTESLDNTCGEFRDRRVRIPSLKILSGDDLARIENFRRQLKNLIKNLEEKSSGQTVAIYKSGLENHFGMAANSARIAEENSEYLSWRPESFQTATTRIPKGELDKVCG